MDKFVECNKPVKLEKIPPGKIKNKLTFENRDKFSLESISNRKASLFDNPAQGSNMRGKKLRLEPKMHKSTIN